MRNGIVLLALAFAACPGDDGQSGPSPDAPFASTAVTVLGSVDDEAAVMASLVDDVDPAGTAEAAASFAVSRAMTAWTPSTCLTVTQDAAHVTFVLDACTGPFALAQVSGSLDVIYSKTTGGIGLSVNSSDLVVNGRTHLHVALAGEYTKSGSQRRFSAHTGADTGSFKREGDYVTAWDEGAACRSLDGTWTSQVGSEATWQSTAAGLVRCAGGCPADGGTLSFTTADGRALMLMFTGGVKAAWTSASGGAGEVDLPFCP